MSTRKSETKQSRIKFIKKTDNDNINPEHKLNKFFQICAFRNPKSKYNVRTVIFNEHQEIIKLSTKDYTANQCKSLLKSLKINQYKIYPTFDLDLVDYPNSDDLIKAQSELLTDEQNYCGYSLV